MLVTLSDWAKDAGRQVGAHDVPFRPDDLGKGGRHRPCTCADIKKSQARVTLLHRFKHRKQIRSAVEGRAVREELKHIFAKAT
jgi:hypothetical protein